MVDDSWNGIRGEVLVEIEQMHFQIFERFTLSLIIGIFVEVTEKMIAVLPPSEFRFHG